MQEPKGMFVIAGEPAIVTQVRRRVLSEFQDLEFFEEGHRYLLHGRQLSSVTTVAHRFVSKPFDEQVQATRYAEKHGQTPAHWIRQWRQNSFRATTLGTKTHAYGESLSYLRAGMPERISPLVQAQYMPQYGFLAPIHPKEEAVLKFMDELPPSMHLVLNEAMVYSGKNPEPSRNLREQISGTFDMLYYCDGSDGQPEGFLILDYKTNASLVSEYCRRFGRRLLPPFCHLTEEDLSIYAIQLSLYGLMLQDIGIPIVARHIVWICDGDYQVIPVEDLSEQLRQTL